MPCKKRKKKRMGSATGLSFGKVEVQEPELKRSRIRREVIAAKRAASRKGKLEKKLHKTIRTVQDLQRKVDNMRKSPMYTETKKDIRKFRKRIPRGKKDDPFDMGFDDFDMDF